MPFSFGLYVHSANPHACPIAETTKLAIKKMITILIINMVIFLILLHLSYSFDGYVEVLIGWNAPVRFQRFILIIISLV